MVEKREKHRIETEGIDLEKLCFLDETGFNSGMARPYGWGREKRLVDHTGDARGCMTTLLSGVTLKGLVEPFAFEGPLNGDIFVQYLQNRLLRRLKDGSALVMDNLSSHKVEAVQKAVAREGRGIRILYLPPYSPDLNPIELLWSKLKYIVQSFKPANFDEIVDAISAGADEITGADIAGWFKHCGYCCSII